MNGRQALDSYRSGACIRLRHHLLVPSHYRRGGPWVRGKREYGLAVGRKGKSILGFLRKDLLGKMSCWDDIPPKRGKDKLESLGVCHRN